MISGREGAISVTFYLFFVTFLYHFCENLQANFTPLIEEISGRSSKRFRVRWCERTAQEIILCLLLDFGNWSKLIPLGAGISDQIDADVVADYYRHGGCHEWIIRES